MSKHHSGSLATKEDFVRSFWAIGVSDKGAILNGACRGASHRDWTLPRAYSEITVMLTLSVDPHVLIIKVTMVDHSKARIGEVSNLASTVFESGSCRSLVGWCTRKARWQFCGIRTIGFPIEIDACNPNQ